MIGYGLTIIRHGETRYNKEKILQGQGVDEPLSETGFKQANAAGVFLSNVKFTHVFASDLLRAKQTAASIIAKNQFCKELAVKYDARLRERKYGVAEGRPLSDLKTMAKASGKQCPSFTPSGGETLDEVKARGKDFFEYLCHIVAQEACQRNQLMPGAAGNGPELAEGHSPVPLTNHCRGLQFPYSSDGDVEMLDANILVVSHGAYMRNWIGYFVSDLGCTLPPTLTKATLSSVSPNTGISKFIITFDNGENIKPKVQCICLHRDDHLGDVAAGNV